MTWQWPTFSIGWLVAFVVLVFIWAAFAFGRVDLPYALVGSALCAVRL